MALSRRLGLRAVLGGSIAALVVLACNGIVGLDDFEKADCSGGGSSCNGDVFVPDSPGNDTGIPSDTGATDSSKVDAGGSLPVSWAAWRMPNYVPLVDAGPVDNPMAYVAATDGVKDTITDLVWRRPIPEGSDFTYAAAQKACAAPFRLPSRIELVTLLDLSQTNARVHPQFATLLPTTAQAVHWTFSEVRVPKEAPPLPTRSYWVVDFGAGGLGTRDEANGKAAVLCVKGAT